VEQLFQWMEKQENQRLRPDRDSYLDLILAWCNAKKTERGELNPRKLYRKVQQGMVDRSFLDQQHFTVVMEAWANSKHPRSAQKGK
jgi:hypothetical protein